MNVLWLICFGHNVDIIFNSQSYKTMKSCLSNYLCYTSTRNTYLHITYYILHIKHTHMIFLVEKYEFKIQKLMKNVSRRKIVPWHVVQIQTQFQIFWNQYSNHGSDKPPLLRFTYSTINVPYSFHKKIIILECVMYNV